MLLLLTRSLGPCNRLLVRGACCIYVYTAASNTTYQVYSYVTCRELRRTKELGWTGVNCIIIWMDLGWVLLISAPSLHDSCECLTIFSETDLRTCWRSLTESWVFLLVFSSVFDRGRASDEISESCGAIFFGTGTEEA